ncbi:MAG: hypothetical protein PVH64_08455 [Bacillota bacterium]|jgi:hypothetical protein
MKMLLGIFLMGCLLTSGTAAYASQFTLDKLTLTHKATEGKETQNWLAAASALQSEWLSAKVTGKFYLPDLADNYEDSSGTDDRYSNVRADLGFSGWGAGLALPLSYKWNENYRINHYGLGYEWRPWQQVKLGVGYSGSRRAALASNLELYNYQLDQIKVKVLYKPQRWRYRLNLTRSDKLYPNFVAIDTPTPSRYNTNYTALKYVWDQEVSYQVNNQLKVKLGYTYANTDYYQDRLREETDSNGIVQTKGKKEGQSHKWELSGNYQLNKGWKLSGSYARSDTTGYNGDYAADSIKLEGKYAVRGQWWLATKLRLADLSYSGGYQNEADTEEDEDPDYNTRFQQALAVEYFRKREAFAYNLEIFAKHYNYKSLDDHGDAGIICTLTWEWLHLDWQLQAAPNGNLSSTRAKYLLKTEYQF